MISTGDLARCSFAPRVGSEHECRCLQTSARPSLLTCGIAVRRRRVAGCFLRTPAPHVGFASGCAITVIAKTALERAGVRGYAHHGAHIFRHSLATELLRSGATLSEIGQLLRHESHDTTRIYAKVDVQRLRTLSLPWPGGAQ
ncbi:tyrosine-type recombinase/integrase [Bradyrhizobium sp. USDA 10063]